MSPSPLLTDDERCLNIHALDKEINAFNTRKGYVMAMIDVEKNSYNTSEEIVKKFEAEQLNLEATLQTLRLNLRRKPIKILNLTKLLKILFSLRKLLKIIIQLRENEQLTVKNSFAALNTANNDAEDVTQPQPKIKPIFMKITPDYNLLLQEIHRTHPTAKNTHMKGYFKIEAETEDHHREITAYLTGKSVGYYVINPPENRPLKLVIKGLPEDVEPEEVKKDLISKGINVEKVAQLKKFATKARLPLFLIEITRDDNVNDIYQIRSVLYMQIKLDPFRKSNRVTQCYNCNNFHHASQNCFMKTRCLKCGENHRTGECSIKEKIENPLCINCNTNGHMAPFHRMSSSLNPERVQGKPPQKTVNEMKPTKFLKQQVWEEHLTSLDTEDGSLWGTAKAFRRKAAPISALNGPTGTALSDTHKTELIAQSLESQFQLNDIQNPRKDEYITNTVDAYFTANTNNTEQIPPALPSEVIFYIKKIKILPECLEDCSCGPDSQTWERSHVSGIPPTYLTPILSKLAEKIISTRLNDFLETNKILIPEQHGFRPRLSTTHQLLRVVEYIKEGNNMGQCTAAVFLDIQKAFDRVWHYGLLFKLINYNIPTPLILLLNSYISNRSFTVKINRTYSQTRSISAGVAQGSILGPVLFNLYVNDILKSTNTMLCMYADDTAILSRHKNLNTR
ncbi:RNA-directed DNA polymerase from mobile element jockey [Trichonephila clavipes]|nr:RNA-directed DNA polymerase from mobile element jockey [Trichonephila clavipes]